MKSRLLIAAVVLACATTAHAGKTITIEIFPSSAPNYDGSPSWDDYVVNALSSLENGLGNIGDRETDPTAYEQAGGIIAPGDIMVTSFSAWRGVADPAAPFDNERGNRLHCGLHAYGDGFTQFTLEDVSFEFHSNDGDGLGLSGSFAGEDYNDERYGVDWGADNAKGGGDDTYFTIGNGTTLVDEIVYVGVGNAYHPGGGDPDPANPLLGRQGALNATAAYYGANQPFIVTCAYAIEDASADAEIEVTPEPGTGLLALLAIGAALHRGRKRS